MAPKENTYLGQKYPGTTNEKKKTIVDMLEPFKLLGGLNPPAEQRLRYDQNARWTGGINFTPDIQRKGNTTSVDLSQRSSTPRKLAQAGTATNVSVRSLFPATENAQPLKKYEIPTVSNTKYRVGDAKPAIATIPGEMRPDPRSKVGDRIGNKLVAPNPFRLTTVPQGNSPRLTSSNPNAERNILFNLDPKTFFTKDWGKKDYAVRPVSPVPQRKRFKSPFQPTPVPGVEAALRQDKEGLGQGVMASRPGQLSSTRSKKGVQVERQISPDKQAVSFRKDSGRSLPTSQTPIKDAKNILREYMTGMQYETDLRPETAKQLLAGDLQTDPRTQQPFRQNPVKGKRVAQRFDNPKWGQAVGGINPDSSIDVLAKTGDQSYEVRRLYGSDIVGTKLNDPDPRFESSRYKEVRAGEAVGNAMDAGKTELIGGIRLRQLEEEGLVRKTTPADIQEVGEYKARGLVGFIRGKQKIDENGNKIPDKYHKIPLYQTNLTGKALDPLKKAPESLYRIGVSGPRDWDKVRSLIADPRLTTADVPTSSLTTQVIFDPKARKRVETGLVPLLNRTDIEPKVAGIRKNYENSQKFPVPPRGPQNPYGVTEDQLVRSFPEFTKEAQAGHHVDNKFPMTSQHALIESYKRVLASAAASGAMVGAPEEVINLMKAADPSRATEVDLFKSPYAYDRTLPRDQQGPTPFTNLKRGEAKDLARAILSQSPDQISTEDIAILDEITKRTAGKPFDVDALGYEDVGMNEGGRKGFRVEDVEGVRARVKDSGIYYQDFDDVVRVIPQRPVSNESLIGGSTIYNTGRMNPRMEVKDLPPGTMPPTFDVAALRARYNADPRITLGQEAHNDPRVLQAGVDGASLNAPAKQTAPVPYMDYRNVAAALGAGNEGNISDEAFLRQRRAEAIIAQRIAARNRMRV